MERYPYLTRSRELCAGPSRTGAPLRGYARSKALKSKHKPETGVAQPNLCVENAEQLPKPLEKRKGGRPPGSKNKKTLARARKVASLIASRLRKQHPVAHGPAAKGSEGSSHAVQTYRTPPPSPPPSGIERQDGKTVPESTTSRNDKFDLPSSSEHEVESPRASMFQRSLSPSPEEPSRTVNFSPWFVKPETINTGEDLSTHEGPQRPFPLSLFVDDQDLEDLEEEAHWLRSIEVQPGSNTPERRRISHREQSMTSGEETIRSERLGADHQLDTFRSVEMESVRRQRIHCAVKQLLYEQTINEDRQNSVEREINELTKIMERKSAGGLDK